MTWSKARGRVAALALVALTMCGAASRVEAACTVTTAGVIFGTYSVFSATALVSTGIISLSCAPNDKNVTVTLSTGSSLTYVSRRLSGPGANVLNYNLFMDSAYTQTWGDGTGGTSFYSNFKPFSVDLTVYGRIPAGQDVQAGAYSDTIVITVNF